jgi:LPS export ABC transporter protein LptC
MVHQPTEFSLYSKNFKSYLLRIPIAFSLVLLLFSCENEISKIKVLSSTEEPPSATAQGYEMLFSDSTVIRFKLQTPELIKYENEKEPYIEFPQGVIIEKYDAKMNVVSKVTANYAKNFPADNRWEAKNNVIAINLNGDTLKTEYLVWDMKSEKIYSDQFVKIIQKDQTFTGVGFESNQDFTEYSFKNLKGHIYVNVEK